MDIKSYPADNSSATVILNLSGELDASNYLDVIEAVRRLYDDGARELVIDLSDLTFLSSSGLVALHSAALIMRGEQPPSPELGWSAFHTIASDIERGLETPCKLANPQGRVLKALEITGFDSFLSIFDTAEAAVESWQGK